MDPSGLYSHDCCNGFNCTSSPEEMTDHGFCRVNFKLKQPSKTTNYSLVFFQITSWG
nr:hypothetical protein Iba_chr01bCG12940 [Ipomoea batatas]GME20217.1 hypothetical protein Iba_scaffold24557CG0040 [Ipomoea batatas]